MSDFLTAIALISRLAVEAQSVPEVRPAVARVCSAPGLLGDSESDLRVHLGVPLRRKVKRTPNIHDERETDTRIDLHFRSADAVLYVVPSAGRSFLAEFRLTGPVRGLGIPVVIGTVESDARSYLGRPDAEKTETFEYRCDYEFGSTLILHHREGRIRRIEWLNWPD